MSLIAISISAAMVLAGCGSSRVASGAATRTTATNAGETLPKAHPQAVEPVAGQAVSPVTETPVGNPNDHAPSLRQVKALLKLQYVVISKSNATYIDPLQFVTVWGRTDQGVDAAMPVGAPILAPCRVKILAIIPNWFAGQPLVYYELLEGHDAGRIQYVAEQITAIAPAGSILQKGQPIARFAASGTEIEFGWSTFNGVTLARATSGYTEGQVTPAGLSIRAWLNALGANAGMR